MSPVRILLVAILIGSAAYWFLDKLKDERARERQSREIQVAIERSKQNGEFVDLLASRSTMGSFVLDRAMSQLSQAYRPSPSPWESAEKARYLSLIPANSFDVLVVPFQVEDYAFDRSTRSLMSAQLVSELRASGARIPDSYPVLRALGESRRQFNTDEIYQLAYRLGVKRVIWTYSGHDRQKHMSFAFRNDDIGSAGRFGANATKELARIRDIGISRDEPPIIAFQAVLPQIITKLGYAPRAASTKQSSPFDGDALPSSPIGMVADQPDPARDAFYFLLFAALTPDSVERTRERFVEKAFQATLPLAESHPDYRLLRARILMLMGLRPAALSALGQASTNEEKALLGMLNGNIQQVAAAALHIKPGLKKILSELDLVAISNEYAVYDNGKALAALKRLAPQGSVWPLFLARSLNDGDQWAQFDNLALKELLDAELPVQGSTAEGIVSGAAALADPAKLRGLVDFAAHNHVSKVIEKDAAKWCCVTNAAHPSQQDYLELIDSISFDNLARHVHFLHSVQGRPQDALVELGRIEAIYKGHPHLSILRAQIESSLSHVADSAAGEGLLRSAYANALDTLYYDQGQTFDVTEAFNLIEEMRRPEFGVPNLFVGDIPARPSYPVREGDLGLGLKNATAALENATINPRPLHEIEFLLSGIQHKDAEFGEVLKSVEGRFEGNADLSTLRAKNSLKLGNSKAAEMYYREAIKSQSISWEPYMQLSELLLHEGRVEASAKAINSYPGFSAASSENKVAIANHAYEAGSNYFWSGHFDLAKWFYTISADLRTGAGSGMSSESRLKLLAGDYAGALQGIYERATRYEVPASYRDYLAFLHAMGHSKEAWDAFNLLANRLPQPYIWESALVGHRMAGSAEQEILVWASQDALRNAGARSSYAAMYVLRAVTTDRIPGESMADSIGKLDRPAWQVADGYNHTVKGSADGQTHYILGPAANDGGYLPGGFDQVKKVRIKSDMQYFSEAYRLLLTGNHDGARALLDEASALYDLSQASQGYMLPYFAFAAAKSKNTAGVEKKLAEFRIEQRQFDYFLAQAVILGIAGKTRDSMLLLKKALYTRPFTESRPMFSEYEYGEIVELLYKSTKQARYRDLALDWARKNQKTQPWHAWPYAMEAKLSRGGPDRDRAIAMAYYLDRNSERLKTIPKREIERAVKEFGPRNPFLNMRAPMEEKPV
jgi:hypothetical protein